MDHDELRASIADLAVEVGANVQPGQVVTVGADIGQVELAREVVAAAYRRGAKYVDVSYFDPYVKRARIAHAADDTLDYVPPWLGYRVLEVGRLRGARISLAGPTTTGLLDDLDHARAGRDQLPFVPEILKVIGNRETNWTIVPCPTPAWARLVYPGADPQEAVDRLWEAVRHICRLDESDPAGAWRSRMANLASVASRINERRFDELHFEGPGTDLHVGLLATTTFMTAFEETIDGIRFQANVPSEEIFGTPDPARARGTVRSTKPLVLVDGTIIRGLTMRFEDGRAVEIDAEQGAEVMRGRTAFDEGAARLGEVALVDREGRIGQLDTVFFDTLLDENAASHIALGDGFDDHLSADDRGRRNRSSIHIDFMIGSDDVDVTGVARDGERSPILRGGSWQL